MKIILLLLPKLLLLLGVGLVLAYTSACVLILLWQNRLIFHPSSVVKTTPDANHLNYEEIWLPVPVVNNFSFLSSLHVKDIPLLGRSKQKVDSPQNQIGSSGKVERLHSWWIPASGNQVGVLLFLHGNGINMGANLDYVCRFHQLGFSVLLIDYRGYGRSVGSFPTESSVYQDAEAAWNYLVQERGVPKEQIFIYGHSLGGAIAIDLGVRQPEAAGLIVEGSFTSIRRMVDYRRHFWLFPADILVNQRFDSITKVPALKMPILFIHGTADTVVPYQMSQMLFEAAQEPKQLILFPDAEHNNLADFVGVQYLQVIQNFIEQVRTRQTQPTERFK